MNNSQSELLPYHECLGFAVVVCLFVCLLLNTSL